MAEWCNGSHNGLKIRWSQDRVGSSPTSATKKLRETPVTHLNSPHVINYI
jgi:hypothetical protein